jgi:hypothetical protein
MADRQVKGVAILAEPLGDFHEIQAQTNNWEAAPYVACRSTQPLLGDDRFDTEPGHDAAGNEGEDIPACEPSVRDEVLTVTVA